MTTLKQIKNVVSADQIARQPDGTIIFRNGYFYRHGNTDVQFRDYISGKLNANNIRHDVIDFGDVYKPFNGGASLARSSHFYVRVMIG